jgi:hypothetical protein
MEDTDFDLLCTGLSTDDARRLRKIFVEWCDGDENGFPIQMALLTRAQWQAAASIPRSLNDSRKWLELHLAEYRQQTAVLVKNFSIANDDKIIAFEGIIQKYMETMEKIASDSHGHLAKTEKAARQIKFELERGVAESKQELKKIRNDIQDERIRLQKSRRDMEARMTWQERFQIIFVLAGFVFLGFLIGRHLIR